MFPTDKKAQYAMACFQPFFHPLGINTYHERIWNFLMTSQDASFKALMGRSQWPGRTKNIPMAGINTECFQYVSVYLELYKPKQLDDPGFQYML